TVAVPMPAEVAKPWGVTASTAGLETTYSVPDAAVERSVSPLFTRYCRCPPTSGSVSAPGYTNSPPAARPSGSAGDPTVTGGAAARVPRWTVIAEYPSASPRRAPDASTDRALALLEV